MERGREERKDGKKTEEKKETKYNKKRECQRKERNRKEILRMRRGGWYLRFFSCDKKHGQKQPGGGRVYFVLQLVVHP